jgi:hypothetical protein
LVRGLRVIRSGLGADDRIVIEGLPRARPGQRVKPEEGKIEGAIAQAMPPLQGKQAGPATSQ